MRCGCWWNEICGDLRGPLFLQPLRFGLYKQGRTDKMSAASDGIFRGARAHVFGVPGWTKYEVQCTFLKKM